MTLTQKFHELSRLSNGDKVKLGDGRTVQFVRLKQKNFVGIMDGKSYNIPVNMFDSLIEKADKDMNAYKNLKKGDPFFIDRGDGKALLFMFLEMRNNNIIGLNPLTKSTARISPSLFGGFVSEINI